MKRLKNVAVRMRPPAPYGGADDTDPDAILDQLAEVETGTGSARNIWDLEEDLGAAPLVLQAPLEDATPALPAKPAMPAHPKTRVLGFAVQGPAPDAFSRRASAAPGDQSDFPAGWIVVVEGPGRGAHFPVTTSVSTIGRAPDQSVSLDFGDTSISRSNHAALAYDAEQNRFFLGHGNKSNIVRRNGQPVLATEELFDGDIIRIGKTSLRFVALCGADFTWEQSSTEGAPHADRD